MSSFFDLFHNFNDLLDSFQEISAAAAEELSGIEKQSLEEELYRMQQEFRALWLSPNKAAANEAGVLAFLENILRQADLFSQQARRAKRFDLVRQVADLQDQIKDCRLYKNAHASAPLANIQTNLGLLLTRPTFTSAAAAYC